MNSTGNEETDGDDEDNTEDITPPPEETWCDLDRHQNLMAARDTLQEFQGRIPPRKKRKEKEAAEPKTQSKPKSENPKPDQKVSAKTILIYVGIIN